MLEKENIICITNTTWEGPYTKSTVQLLSLLAKNNKVLFIEYPFTIKDLLMTWIGRNNAPIAQMLGFKDRLILKRTAYNTEVYTWVAFPILPMNFIRNESIYQIVFQINVFLYKRSITKALKRLNMLNPIAVAAYNPSFGEALMGKLNEKANIYYCYDGYASQGWFGSRILNIDRSFCQKADGVIVTSDYLKKEKLQFTDHVITVKNGVDFSLFDRYCKKSIPDRTRKKIGYIGSIDERFDIDTIEHCVQNLSDFDFEIIGDLRNKEVQLRLEIYSNVKILPPIGASDVPKALNDMDLSLIPYISDDFTRRVYPLKINEYLAVGLPVVSTNFAELPEFENYVSFAGNKYSFKDAIVDEIKNDCLERIIVRNHFAKQNSWEKRAETFAEAINKFLKKQHGVRETVKSGN